jgi:hypothetical protein
MRGLGERTPRTGGFWLGMLSRLDDLAWLALFYVDLLSGVLEIETLLIPVG